MWIRLLFVSGSFFVVWTKVVNCGANVVIFVCNVVNSEANIVKSDANVVRIACRAHQ